MCPDSTTRRPIGSLDGRVKDQSGEILWKICLAHLRQQVAFLRRGLNHHGRRAREPHHFHVGHPIGRWHDHLVPLAAAGQDALPDALLGAVAQDDLLWLVFEAVLLCGASELVVEVFEVGEVKIWWGSCWG